MKHLLKTFFITFILIQAVQAGRYYNTENGRFITVEGTHNKFPNYEANINGVWLYSFSSTVTPGMISSSIGLQSSTEFAGQSSILLD